MVYEVTEAEFPAKVLERSAELPVLVDFWAEWCGPCKQLAPALEAEVIARAGAVGLAKVDIEANRGLAADYGIQSIPNVKVFRDGFVVDEFLGALPPEALKEFIDGLIPSEADELARAGDEDSLREALALDPEHLDAARGLARILLRRDDPAAAEELLQPFPADFVNDGLLARAELSGGTGQRTPEFEAAVSSAFAAHDDDDPARALESLQAALGATTDAEDRDRIRRAMVAIFTELGVEHELSREHRRRLATALN